MNSNRKVLIFFLIMSYEQEQEEQGMMSWWKFGLAKNTERSCNIYEVDLSEKETLF